MYFANPNPDPDPACCWIRIQPGSIFRPRFVMTKFVQIYNWKLFWSKTVIPGICLLKPLQRTFWLLRKIFALFPQFNCLDPDPVSPIRNRVPWPHWILIRNTGPSLYILPVIKVKLGFVNSTRDQILPIKKKKKYRTYRARIPTTTKSLRSLNLPKKSEWISPTF